MKFKECSICPAKPGSPTLCESCLSNRETIRQLEDTIDALEQHGAPIQRYTAIIHCQTCNFQSDFQGVAFHDIQERFESHCRAQDALWAVLHDESTGRVASTYQEGV